MCVRKDRQIWQKKCGFVHSILSILLCLCGFICTSCSMHRLCITLNYSAEEKTLFILGAQADWQKKMRIGTKKETKRVLTNPTSKREREPSSFEVYRTRNPTITVPIKPQSNGEKNSCSDAAILYNATDSGSAFAHSICIRVVWMWCMVWIAMWNWCKYSHSANEFSMKCTALFPFLPHSFYHCTKRFWCISWCCSCCCCFLPFCLAVASLDIYYSWGFSKKSQLASLI